MKKTRAYALNALLVIGAVALCVGAGFALDSWLDLGLRRGLATAFQSNLQRAEPIMYVYDNRSGWRLNPHTQYHRARTGPFLGLAGMERFDTILRVNSDGFIDREHFLRTPHYRIAFVGNSWVEAVQQDYEARFPPLTEEYVFSRSKESKVVEIMNFGTSNLAPAQAYGVIDNFVLKYEPNEVWLFVNGADVRSNTPVDTPPPFGPTFVYTDAAQSELADIRFGFVDPPAYARWKRQRDLGKYIEAAADFRKVMPYFYSDRSDFVFDRVWQDMTLAVGLINKRLQRSHTRMRLVYMPGGHEIDPILWQQYRADTAKALGRELPMDPAIGERRYAALAQKLGIEFLSLTPVCRENGAQVMFSDHFTRIGHHYVADYLARAIIASTPGADRLPP